MKTCSSDFRRVSASAPPASPSLDVEVEFHRSIDLEPSRRSTFNRLPIPSFGLATPTDERVCQPSEWKKNEKNPGAPPYEPPPPDQPHPLTHLHSGTAMLLGRCLTRRPLGVVRPSGLRGVNADCNGIVAVLVLNRGAGGVPGKRRKYRGDYKVRQAPTAAGLPAASWSAFAPLAADRCVLLSLFLVCRNHCVAFRLVVLHSVTEKTAAK